MSVTNIIRTEVETTTRCQEFLGNFQVFVVVCCIGLDKQKFSA